MAILNARFHSPPGAVNNGSSLSEARLPSEWKLGNVKALYKQKGKRNDPGNYRPISLTSVIGKIMEALIKDEIVEHFMQNMSAGKCFDIISCRNRLS